MSTISTEQAKDLRNAFECWQQDYDPVEDKAQYDMFGLGVVAMDELLALRKERERAEPAYYLNQIDYGDGEGFELRAYFRELDAMKSKDDFGGVVIPAYTAPPAPEVPAAYEINDDATDYHLGWNACRAAMLKSGNDDIGSWSNHKNTPTDKAKSEMSQKAEQLVRDTTALAVTLSAETDTTSQQFESLAGKAVGGWIPCSERMPDLKQEILCVNQWGEVEAAIYDVGYIPGEPFFATSAGEFYPTHWHALPELPCK
ncbi:DUF551 domain-containing protein [Cronobacter sakazakii]|nr:DUF551 domain-containing protein [Cronobacter sakazakii]